MTERNLWGELPTTSEIVTPLQIIREQAALLATLTKGLLEGKVNVSTTETNIFNITLYIVAPSLSYSALIARVNHRITLYPATIFDVLATPSTPLQCENEAALVQRLERILRSAKVRTLIAALVSQVHASK